MYQVVWSPAAVAQLRAIRSYIAQFNPRAAEVVAAHLLAAGNSLEHFPHRDRPVPGTSLRELIADYRYIIRYRSHGIARFASCAFDTRPAARPSLKW